MIDSTNTPLFTAFRKEHRPLSGELENLAVDKSGIQKAFRDIETVEQLDVLEHRWPRMLKKIRPQSPKLAGAGVRPTGSGAYRPIDEDGTHQQGTTRYLLAIQIVGDPHLLHFWPDTVDDVPEPTADDMWKFGPEKILSGGTSTMALHSYIDLTQDEEIAVENDGTDLMDMFRQRIDHVERIVAKIAEQTNVYFDQEFPKWLTDRLSQKRTVLERRETIVQSLNFNRSWQIDPPVLEPLTNVNAGDDAGDSEDSTTEPSVADHNVLFRDRLAPASFEDLVKVIRVWANAVERTPAAFADLKEDHLSSLLAATLNATLPGAAREVFTRTGKSDIFITADKFDEGRGPARVFICEAKIATSNQVVIEALQPQLFSYLNTHDTAAVLLLFFKQRNFRGVTKRRLTALEQIPGFTKRSGEHSEWPVLEYQVEDRTVRICVASVHLAPYEA